MNYNAITKDRRTNSALIPIDDLKFIEGIEHPIDVYETIEHLTFNIEH